MPPQSDQAQRHQESLYLLVSDGFSCGSSQRGLSGSLTEVFLTSPLVFHAPSSVPPFTDFLLGMTFCCVDMRFLGWGVTLRNMQLAGSGVLHALCGFRVLRYLLRGAACFISEDLGGVSEGELPALAGRWGGLGCSVAQSRPEGPGHAVGARELVILLLSLWKKLCHRLKQNTSNVGDATGLLTSRRCS